MSKMHPTFKKIMVRSGQRMITQYKGAFKLKNDKEILFLKNVLYIPGFSKNILSLSNMVNNDNTEIRICKNHMIFMKEGIELVVKKKNHITLTQKELSQMNSSMKKLAMQRSPMMRR